MNDRRKTKAQLIEELEELRLRVAQVEADAARAPDPCATDPAVLERFVSQGAWVVDTDFIVRVANDAMCRMLDLPPKNIVGKKCYDLLQGPGCHSEQCAMRRAFAAPGSVAVEETRTTIGRVPIACRVVAHVVHDTGREPAGIVEHLDDPAQRDGKRAARSSSAARPPTSLPATRRLAEAAERVVESLRHHPPDDDALRGDVDALEAACAPFRANGKPSKPKRREAKKPALRELASHRSVLIVAPPSSRIRGAWTDVVRRAGYALCTDDDHDVEPTVAILDLVLGEPVADDLHRQLREEHPNVPILVVSLSRADALEARRWRRAQTWYVPRTIAGDELVRLIEDVTPKPVLRTRPER